MFWESRIFAVVADADDVSLSLADLVDGLNLVRTFASITFAVPIESESESESEVDEEEDEEGVEVEDEAEEDDEDEDEEEDEEIARRPLGTFFTFAIETSSLGIDERSLRTLLFTLVIEPSSWLEDEDAKRSRRSVSTCFPFVTSVSSSLEDEPEDVVLPCRAFDGFCIFVTGASFSLDEELEPPSV